MIYKILITILLLNLGIFAQQAILFKTPPGNISLPSVIADENSAPKTNGMGILESKWISTSESNAEALLQTYSNSTDIGIRKIINDILLAANIPDEKINKLKVNFTSTGIEERGINKDDVVFNDDFAAKYPAESMLLITKLYRSKNAVIEITETGAAEFDPAVKNALSEGLRFGNKTETTQENKMRVEIQNMVYAFENQPINITRFTDKSIVIPEYFASDVGINSIGNMTVTEFGPNDYFVKVVSPAVEKPVEFKISAANPTASFKVGGRESYSIKYIEISGNKITFSLSGFMVSFP